MKYKNAKLPEWTNPGLSQHTIPPALPSTGAMTSVEGMGKHYYHSSVWVLSPQKCAGNIYEGWDVRVPSTFLQSCVLATRSHVGLHRQAADGGEGAAYWEQTKQALTRLLLTQLCSALHLRLLLSDRTIHHALPPAPSQKLKHTAIFQAGPSYEHAR